MRPSAHHHAPAAPMRPNFLKNYMEILQEFLSPKLKKIYNNLDELNKIALKKELKNKITTMMTEYTSIIRTDYTWINIHELYNNLKDKVKKNGDQFVFPAIPHSLEGEVRIELNEVLTILIEFLDLVKQLITKKNLKLKIYLIRNKSKRTVSYKFENYFKFIKFKDFTNSEIFSKAAYTLQFLNQWNIRKIKKHLIIQIPI